MNRTEIPEPIVNAATGMLAPYRPGLTPQQLELALDFPEKPTPADKILSRKEASEALHISMPTIDRMLASGELPKIKVRGRVFIRESAVRAIIEGTAPKAD